MLMRIAFLVSVAILALSQGLPAQAPAAAPAGDVERGKKLFLERGCWECHGYAAHGGAGSGPRLAGRTPAWTTFSTYVRRPTDEMIPYTTKMITDQELADIYAWLKAIPPPPSMSSIPELKQ
jgi:ubiquinol-cytochrome c reductase cytochrome c subunit